MRAGSLSAVLSFALVIVISTQPCYASCSSSVLPTPNGGPDANVLTGIAGSSESDVWAVGRWGQGGVIHTLIEHFDGSAWSVVPSPNDPHHHNDDLNSVSVFSPSDAWAVGGAERQTRPFAAHWDGTAWSEVPIPRFGFGPGNFPAQYLISVSVNPLNPSDVWVMGNAPSGGIRNEPAFIFAEHWNGARWTIYPLHGLLLPKLYAVSTAPSGAAWAVGAELGSGTQWSITEWNGSQWNPQNSVGTHDHLFGVAALADDDVWAVGTRIEHFDGQSWQPSHRPSSLILTAVSPLAADDVWAAGFNEAVAHFDGRIWSVIPQPPLNYSTFNGIFAFPNGAITAGVVGRYAMKQRTLSTITTCVVR